MNISLRMGYVRNVVDWKVTGVVDHQFSSRQIWKDPIIKSNMKNKLLLFVGNVVEHKKDNLEMIDVFIANIF